MRDLHMDPEMLVLKLSLDQLGLDLHPFERRQTCPGMRQDLMVVVAVAPVVPG